MADIFTRIGNRSSYLVAWLHSRPAAVRVGIAVLAVVVVGSFFLSRHQPTSPARPLVDTFPVPDTATLATPAEADDSVPAQEPEPEPHWYRAQVDPTGDEETVNPFTGDSLAAEQAARTAKRRLDATRTALDIAAYDLKIARKQQEAARIRHDIRALTNPPQPPAPPQPPPLPPARVVAITNTAALVTVGARRAVIETGQTFYGWTVLRCDPHGVRLAFRDHHTVIPLVFAQPGR